MAGSSWRIAQGVEMGRPSILNAEADKENGIVVTTTHRRSLRHGRRGVHRSGLGCGVRVRGGQAMIRGRQRGVTGSRRGLLIAGTIGSEVTAGYRKSAFTSLHDRDSVGTGPSAIGS